jgi:hypothetical protein
MLYPAELRARESFQWVSNGAKLFGSFLALVVASTFRLVRQQVAFSGCLFKTGNRFRVERLRRPRAGPGAETLAPQSTVPVARA